MSPARAGSPPPRRLPLVLPFCLALVAGTADAERFELVQLTAFEQAETSADLTPAAGAGVRVMPPATGGGVGDTLRLVTDGEGRALFKVTRLGTFVLEVAKEGFGTVKTSFEIRNLTGKLGRRTTKAFAAWMGERVDFPPVELDVRLVSRRREEAGAAYCEEGGGARPNSATAREPEDAVRWSSEAIGRLEPLGSGPLLGDVIRNVPSDRRGTGR